jgi:hypothetical protein
MTAETRNEAREQEMFSRPHFLVDVNLPTRFSLWNTPEFIHQRDIDDT